MRWSPRDFWQATIIELVTAGDGFLGAKGENVDERPFLTLDETAALEAHCREMGLIA